MSIVKLHKNILITLYIFTIVFICRYVIIVLSNKGRATKGRKVIIMKMTTEGFLRLFEAVMAQAYEDASYEGDNEKTTCRKKRTQSLILKK